MTADCRGFADIEKFSGDAMFRHLVGKDIPSQETFRHRMNRLSETSWTPVTDGIVAALLRKASPGRISMYGTDYIPLDIDVSVLEDTTANKEGFAMSYHQAKGYATIFYYAGTQGYMVADEIGLPESVKFNVMLSCNRLLESLLRKYEGVPAARQVFSQIRAFTLSTTLQMPLFSISPYARHPYI